MPHGLTYADAVKLLGGPTPLVKAADNLLGGALSLATAGGSDLALSLFDAKAEAIRVGHLLLGRINESVRGLGRHDRSVRLQAAHSVLVVTAFFEALDDCLAAAGLASPGFTREDQVRLAAPGTVERDWPALLLAAVIPGPSPDRPYDYLVRELTGWFAVTARRLAAHLSGYATWRESGRRVIEEQLPHRAAERYETALRRLAEEIPEFAIWMRMLETRAATRGLESLEAALLRATAHRDPARLRAALATAYRARLDLPILGGDVGDVVMPTLAEAYVDPLFRVQPAGAGARPAEDAWWDGEPRDDFADFFGTFVTTPPAADSPMLLLGQPGAGKSSLTRILAARLPAGDFLVVRVALRDVRAEAEIQSQIEQALRAEIGEDVAWADLVREADGAMPVILLDGFDELLQATGVHQSDYLHRVAEFQQREKILGRPVTVLVTSRMAVADRARLPTGGLVVRLEPFDEPRIARWLDTWNGVNPDRPLSSGALRRVPDLAAQPLLLLMLALYAAAGNMLPHGDSIDTGQLYERLLSEFADREVRRVYAGQPDAVMPRLVEQELMRLSVVAFAMFHRSRLWATAAELDGDLAGLGLQSSRPAHTAEFRTPLTAGQEMVGRFFFIQRAQAVRDGQTLQTYEFLHATFGEYLVARLVVQALRDTAARDAAGTLPLRLGQADDDLLQSLLGVSPLSARATVLPFVTAMLEQTDGAAVRGWVVERLREAVTRPQYPRTYQPVYKRIDHWMATYSFNLALLALACGGSLRASELFRQAKDPAAWLRNTAQQWRAAIPSGMWLEAIADWSVVREFSADGRRDLVVGTSGPPRAGDIDPYWSHGFAPDDEQRTRPAGSDFSVGFPLTAALASMELSDDLGEDMMRHAVGPLLARLPDAISTFVVHGPADTESVAHSLVNLWLTSLSAEPPEALTRAYDRAIIAVNAVPWISRTASVQAVTGILRSLVGDAERLSPAEVERLAIGLNPLIRRLDAQALITLADKCLTAAGVPDDGERRWSYDLLQRPETIE